MVQRKPKKIMKRRPGKNRSLDIFIYVTNEVSILFLLTFVSIFLNKITFLFHFFACQHVSLFSKSSAPSEQQQQQ